MHNAEIKRIYLDNSLLVGWFLPYLRETKNPNVPQIIDFLSNHKEIEVFVSHFSIAELMEDLLFKEPRIRQHMRKPDIILHYFETLTDIINLKIITHIGKNGIEGNFVSKEIIDFTILCKQPKDSIHVAIAKYQDLIFVTHDTKATILSKLYNNILTDNHLFKLFKI
ncbi:MAG: hypothetical protein Q7S21_04155 [archaeon]|nr:hypothetical protein [archaeon]